MATGTPAPTTGTGKTKKWWIIHVAAGVAAVALVVFGATQCSGKKSERSEKEVKKSELVAANQTLDSLSAAMRKATTMIDDLSQDNLAKAETIRKQSDTIRTKRDSIAMLNDSLTVVNDKLKACSKSKRQPAQKSEQKATTPVNQVTAKPDTIIIVQQPVRTECGGATNVSLNNSQNNGAIVVGGAACKTEIKLDNNSVNNGAIVVGNGNNVVVNTPAAVIAADSLARARKVQNVQFTAVFVTKSK